MKVLICGRVIEAVNFLEYNHPRLKDKDSMMNFEWPSWFRPNKRFPYLYITMFTVIAILMPYGRTEPVYTEADLPALIGGGIVGVFIYLFGLEKDC